MARRPASQSTSPSSNTEDEGIGASGATERYFAILEYVARIGKPLTPIEISEALSLPKPTAYRLIDTLERMGYLTREGNARRIVTGQRLTDLAFSVLRAAVRHGPRRQILDTLVQEVGETGNIGTIDRNEIVYLDRVEADHWPLRLQFNIGSRVPLYCSAMGKLFLALMPETESSTLIEQLALTRYTPNTITDRTALEAELAEIRERRISLDREEYIAGVVCIAAPIFDRSGNIQAAVAVQGPSARMPVERALTHRTALTRAASQLSESLNEVHSKQ